MYWPPGYFDSGYWVDGYWPDNPPPTVGWAQLFWSRFGTVPTFYWINQYPGNIPQTYYDLLYSINPENLEWMFPQWMIHHYSTDPVSGALFHRFLTSTSTDINLLYTLIQRRLDKNILNMWRGEPRAGWFTDLTTPVESITSVVLHTSYGSSVIPVCYSEYEFLDAIIPCCIFTDTAVYFRNLHKAVRISYNCAGSVPFNYSDFVPEDDVLLGQNGWVVIPANSSLITNNSINFPLSGTVYTVYSSYVISNLLDTATVSINNGPRLTLYSTDYWNNFDELGLSLGYHRFNGETNNSLFNRLKGAHPLSLGPSEDGIEFGVGNQLDLAGVQDWTAATTSWPASSCVTNVCIKDLDYTGYTVENLYSIGNNVYVGTRQNWELSVVVSGNEILSTAETSGRVLLTNITNTPAAHYRFSNYTKTSSGDYIIEVSPCANTPGFPSIIGYVRGIHVHTLNKPSYAPYIFDSLGKPNQYLLSVADLIRERVRVTLGWATWGTTYWATGSEAAPHIDYLPEVLD